LTADERDALRNGLLGLPDTMPPRAVWHRIREQAEAEGLIARPAARRPSTWYVGGSLAAAIVVAVLMVPGIFEKEPVVYPTTPDSVGTSSPIRLNTLQTLMTESRELESNLRDLPDKPRVMRAGTAATIVDIEDRIAAIDPGRRGNFLARARQVDEVAGWHALCAGAANRILTVSGEPFR
jgi:hypothetical protein